jgi:hypothetical protein
VTISELPSSLAFKLATSSSVMGVEDAIIAVMTSRICCVLTD